MDEFAAYVRSEEDDPLDDTCRNIVEAISLYLEAANEPAAVKGALVDETAV
ncbi:MAG: hypothetical protein ACLP9L_40670 [Thermoguttaceae bacterium]